MGTAERFTPSPRTRSGAMKVSGMALIAWCGSAAQTLKAELIRSRTSTPAIFRRIPIPLSLRPSALFIALH